MCRLCKIRAHAFLVGWNWFNGHVAAAHASDYSDLLLMLLFNVGSFWIYTKFVLSNISLELWRQWMANKVCKMVNKIHLSSGWDVIFCQARFRLMFFNQLVRRLARIDQVLSLSEQPFHNRNVDRKHLNHIYILFLEIKLENLSLQFSFQWILIKSEST